MKEDLVNLEQIQDFLLTVDYDFPVPLSSKVNICKYAEKIYEKATICAYFNEDDIVGLVAGYTENLTDNMAYIALVGVKAAYRGKGIAKKLVVEFINKCRGKQIRAVHLYTDKKNTKAIDMYEKLGFRVLILENEKRTQDIHYIYQCGIEKGRNM